MLRTILIFFFCLIVAKCETPVELTEVPLFNIEGHAALAPDMFVPPNWQVNSRVLLDYGKYIGFLKDDGSFIVEGIAPGSYVLEVTNVDYIFEPIRIDITSKGKIRARKLNVLQPNSVHTLPYPLRIQARQPTKYFRQREQWRATDVLMNPMVLMLIVAFGLMVLTPKLVANDPQLQKELQQGVQMPKMDMPDMSEMLANFLGGNTKKPAASKQKQSSGQRRQR